jgi:hypothetical protein
VKTFCALVGAFFLVAGLAVLIGGAPDRSRRAGSTRLEARVTGETVHRPLLWEAQAVGSAAAGGREAAEAVSRRR